MSKILKNFKVISLEGEPFQIPGTEIKIWKLKGEVDGVRDLYSTMSKAIAVEGFIGDVELYENDKGNEYIRQAPKADTSGGQSASSGFNSEGMAWGNALTNAVATVAINKKASVLPVDQLVAKVLEVAEKYFEGRPEPAQSVAPVEQPAKTPSVDAEVPDEVHTTMPFEGEQINLDDIPF